MLVTVDHRQHRLAPCIWLRSPFPVETQLDFMQQVAAQVAVAVDNTLNYEKAEKYRQQVALERDRLQILLEITNALVSELGIRELFPTISSCLSVLYRMNMRASLCAFPEPTCSNTRAGL